MCLKHIVSRDDCDGAGGGVTKHQMTAEFQNQLILVKASQER